MAAELARSVVIAAAKWSLLQSGRCRKVVAATAWSA